MAANPLHQYNGVKSPQFCCHYFNAKIPCNHVHTEVIGGHGFWGRGGVYTRGVSEKILAPPSVVPTPGGENFFSGGYFISRPRGHFAKNCKIGGPFGTPGCTPPAFGRGVCRLILGFRGGVHPPPTVPIYAHKMTSA